MMPILILSIHDHDTDKIDALDAGADDFVVKSFSMGELMARMRAALRHVSPGVDSRLAVFISGDVVIDLTAHTVKIGSWYVSLPPTEHGLLYTMINHAGKVMTHRQLWQAIRHEDGDEKPHLIRVHMSNLRRKLEANPTNPQYIVTEPGVGYRLRLDD